MTNDGRKGLVFSYNVLNLPSGVATTASGSLTYTYLSDGTKVSAIKSDGTGERYIGSFVYSVPASGSETLESAAWDEDQLHKVRFHLHQDRPLVREGPCGECQDCDERYHESQFSTGA